MLTSTLARLTASMKGSMCTAGAADPTPTGCFDKPTPARNQRQPFTAGTLLGRRFGEWIYRGDYPPLLARRSLNPRVVCSI